MTERTRFVLIGALIWLITLTLTTLGWWAESESATVEQIRRAADMLPSEPPRADKISFGPLNGLGESTVTGAPGAVLPDAHVLLVNLESSHQAHVRSAPDGSFSTAIFAPPGSNIMIKHGPDHLFQPPEATFNPWVNVDDGATGIGRNAFPSTTVHRPHTHGGGPDALPFAAAGASGVSVETSPSTIDAGWSVSGTVSPSGPLQPGDRVTVQATVRLYSQAISSSTDLSQIDLFIPETVRWLMLYNGQGRPLPYNGFAGAARLTPSGFPILDMRRPEARSRAEWQAITWQLAGDHVVEGELMLELTLEEPFPPGIYRPILNLYFSGVPAGDEWRAALLSVYAGLSSVNIDPSGAVLPPLEVQSSAGSASSHGSPEQNPRLIWHLLMDNPSLGIRGTGAVQDREIYQPASFVVTQGAPYILPPADPFSGEPYLYRLEPYLPMISHGRGTTPSPPLLPFKLPGGELCITIHQPDGQQRQLGCEPFAQSISGDRTTSQGQLLNFGSVEVSEYYGLTTASNRFVVPFTQSGYHVVEMHGWVEDVWGNRYEGGGDYEIWIAHPIDVDPGLLPGTPLAIGDALNPTVQLHPRLPAHVILTLQHFPYSDPEQRQVHVIEGWANRFGYFNPDRALATVNQPGEYRFDLLAEYVDPQSGEVYATSATWGGVVMTPVGQAQLVAHGLRGIDSVTKIPGAWYILDRLCDEREYVLEGAQPHLPNPYLNGDIIWSRADQDIIQHSECAGEALYMVSSVQDTVGTVQSAIVNRFDPTRMEVSAPGTFAERVAAGELPLFSSTNSGLPVSMDPEDTVQIGYAYLSSQRPGARVREVVAEDVHASGYWRFDSMYDHQPGIGLQSDLPNDFKFQYVGAVYRDSESGLSEYLGQASGWVHLPESDTVGSRVMPPFSGAGNGGWPTAGGPILTLKGEEIDMFLMPTGVRPGAILQVGDTFDFAGHVMPTLNSRVEVEIIAPSGSRRVVSGQANRVGYFYEPEDRFVVDEPGLWTANVTVWHDGQIGSGEFVNCDPANPFDPARPCPSGNVLGSANGGYAFYVVAPESPRLTVTSPAPGRLSFGDQVTPIEVSGLLPPGITNAAVDYTISMPGFILEQGQAQIGNGQFSFIFDPATLHADFPNLDLTSVPGVEAGLSDTFSFGLLLSGEQGGTPLYRATTLTIQADHVYVENAVDVDPFQHRIYLPGVVTAD